MSGKRENIIHDIGTVRPQRLFTTGGPGAIMNLKHDSIMVLDPSLWSGRNIMDVIDEPGLASCLKVRELRRPYGFLAGKTHGQVKVYVGVSAASFPKFHICRNCGYLFDVAKALKEDWYYNLYEASYKNKGTFCPECGASEAYPVGYVLVCENGHMQDFPWSLWLHGNGVDCDGKLYYKKNGHKGGFSPEKSYFGETGSIVCEKCGAERSLTEKELRLVLPQCKCKGIHPQLPNMKWEKNCCANMHVLRKDAANVTFPVTQKTVSILPLFSEEKYNEMQYKDLVGDFDQNPDDPMKKGYDKIDQAANALGNISDVYKAGVKEVEYNVITQYDKFRDNLVDETKLNVVDSEVGECFETYFSRLLRVRRMREIQALIGFTRVHAIDSQEAWSPKMVQLKCGKESQREKSWLPAMEMKGEGVFLELNKNKVDCWKNIPAVAERSEKFRGNYQKFCENKGWNPSEDRDAQYVLLHTLSHLLIREMSLHSGYSVAELKERIYSGDEMCGLLIYTTSSDMSGTLGGLEELGEWERFEPILVKALLEAKTCASDPQCAVGSPFDRTMSGTGSLNGAACHSCTLIPDIACENQNLMLDRSLVVPLSGCEELAFFQNI